MRDQYEQVESSTMIEQLLEVPEIPLEAKIRELTENMSALRRESSMFDCKYCSSTLHNTTSCPFLGVRDEEEGYLDPIHSEIEAQVLVEETSNIPVLCQDAEVRLEQAFDP